MTKIKLCGLSRIEDIEAANRLRPDYIGFVLWEKSSRYVSRDKARVLKEALDPGIQAVGVFVDEEPEVIAGYLNEGIIDLAQLHGSEDRAYMDRLRSLAPDKEIIRAIQIKSRDGLLQELSKFEKAEPDYYLLDSGTGSGQSFNRELIRDIEIGRRYFLAGGLDADNVSSAVRELSPYAVDVSSGIETDRSKDPAKMEKFVRAVKGAEYE